MFDHAKLDSASRMHEHRLMLYEVIERIERAVPLHRVRTTKLTQKNLVHLHFSDAHQHVKHG